MSKYSTGNFLSYLSIAISSAVVLRVFMPLSLWHYFTISILATIVFGFALKIRLDSKKKIRKSLKQTLILYSIAVVMLSINWILLILEA
ncbi:MAG: hypothetical protein HRT72_05815 [Flavobacteriales bacterium]|nr:hypothetical protein [Flavobacteriales bacterium]